MLLILPLLLFSLTDAKEIEKITRRGEMVLKELNKILNPELQWCDELVSLAFDEIMHNKTANVTAKVEAKHDFSTSDSTLVAVKVIEAMAKPLEQRQRQIEALRNGTSFGCNGIIRKNYTKGHDRMEIICLYKTECKIEKITFKARMMLKLFNELMNSELKWSDELVKLALAHIMRNKTVKVTEKVEAEYDFKTSDRRPVALKAITAVQEPLEEKQRQIEALRNGTYFGCNGIIRKNYTKGYDRMEIICLYKTESYLTRITHRARMMLKELNELLNPGLRWSKKLVRQAFEELMHTRFVKATAKVKAKRDFKRSDRTPMEVKVIITVSKRFGKKEKKIEALRNGTHFGCDGIFIKRYKKRVSRMEIACLYKTK